jgi:hypothetical protein
MLFHSGLRLWRLVLVLPGAFFLAAVTADAQCTLPSAAVWNTISGQWSSAASWTPNGVPNNKNICLTNGTALTPVTTTLTTGAGVPNAQIGAHNTLNLSDTTFFLNAGASILNSGIILVGGTGLMTTFEVGDGSATPTKLSGGGIVRISSNATRYGQIWGEGGVTLENIDNTIQGTGHVGGNGNNLIFQNDSGGTLSANVNAGTLVLDAHGVVNAGHLTATGGGTLQISTTVNNSGGTISSDAGSKVVLGNTTIQGGTLNGNIQATPNTILDGATHGQLINAGNLTNPNGNLLTAGGTIVNSGAISLSASGSATSLYVGNGPATTVLSGHGTLTLADTGHAGNAMIYGDGESILENQGNTIQGEGQIGAGHRFALNNDAGGTVNANVTGRSLILSGGVFTNSGLMEATNQGKLEIATNINNAGGTITSDNNANSLVLLDSRAFILGGNLSGNIRTNGIMAILDGDTDGPITTNANLTVTNNATLYASGIINNFGNLVLNGGTVYMDVGTLTNNYQILGSGTILGTGSITSNSVIQGLGATLDLSGEHINNLSGGTLTGGAWWSGELFGGQAAGAIKLPGNITTNASDIELIGSGAQILNATNTSALSGFTTNIGSFAVMKAASFTTGGSLTNDNAAGLSEDGLTITEGASATIGGDLLNTHHAHITSGQSFAGVDGGSSLTVTGKITNDSSSTVQVSLGSISAQGFDNQGTVSVDHGAITIGSGGYHQTGNPGNTLVAALGHVNVAGDYTQDGGSTTIRANGTITAYTYLLNGGTLLVDGILDPANVIIGEGAELAGHGVIDADVSNSGSISPGSGSAPGTLTIHGDYAQSPLGFFEEEIDSLDDFGQLVDWGMATLDGTLDISLQDGYVPDMGATFYFLEASAVNGEFAHLNGLAINNLEVFDVSYNGSSVELTVVPTPEPRTMELLAGALLVGVWFAGRRRNYGGGL